MTNQKKNTPADQGSAGGSLPTGGDVKADAEAKAKADKEAADKEAADKEAADKEAADKEAADKEAADKEAKRIEDEKAEKADKAKKEANTKEKREALTYYKLKHDVTSVFLKGQHYTKKDKAEFAEDKAVLAKYKAGYLVKIEK